MNNLQGELFFVWIVATPAACALGAWLARRYRAALLPLMRAPAPTPGGARCEALAATTGVASATVAMPAWHAPAQPTLTAWQRAEWRLIALLVGLSALIALTDGVITESLVSEGDWRWRRMLLLAALLAWPVLPAIGALRRWSRTRLVLALTLWFGAALVLAMLRSTEAQSVGLVVQWLLWQMGPPTLAFLLLTLPRTRAAAPWLWPPLALLTLAALLGLDLLGWFVNSGSALVPALVQHVKPIWAFAGFALAAVALAWWPVQRFAHALARAYARGWVSDLMVLFFVAWALTLSFDALASGPLVLLALLWIPLALWLLPQLRPGTAPAPPTLLVLRVFKQDAKVNALFEDVVERWRVVGNTVLIAGTDLVDQTLDVADLFDFLDERLAERFVRDASQVSTRIASFDWMPDADGRWRVNECYCHDSTWQVALAALVQVADRVLMDLRGFQAHNAGCRFELGVIARAPHVQRVVVLTDPSTDKVVAQSDAAAGPPGRFVWIELPADGARARREVTRRVRAALVGAVDESPHVGPLAARPS